MESHASSVFCARLLSLNVILRDPSMCLCHFFGCVSSFLYSLSWMKINWCPISLHHWHVSYFLFNICRLSSGAPLFILDIGNLCFFSFSLSVFLRVYSFVNMLREQTCRSDQSLLHIVFLYHWLIFDVHHFLPYIFLVVIWISTFLRWKHWLLVFIIYSFPVYTYFRPMRFLQALLQAECNM